jgi:ribosomal protection tetracycline resistance protein
MKTLNVGILAHVDAGKTSLTERLLFEQGLIPTLGKVDTGNTQTDSLELEKQRGITIQSAVVSFQLNNLKINLIDTPGHSDFVAEVERALSVLDAVILVISAVKGVQPQTLILARILKKMKIPVLVFVNKIDCRGAQYLETTQEIQAKLFSNVLVLNSVTDLGKNSVSTTPVRQIGFLPDLTSFHENQKSPPNPLFPARLPHV